MKQLTRFSLAVVCLCALGTLALAQRIPIPPRPGFQPKVAATVSNQRPGSILVFPIFAYGNGSTTEVILTNTHESEAVQVRVFYVLQSGQVVSQLVAAPIGSKKLEPPASVSASTGYIFAVAVNESGLPIGFNYLIGSEQVSLNTGHKGRLTADAYPALFEGTLPGADAGDSEALLALDGYTYGLAASRLAVGDLQPTLNTSAVLIFNSLPPTLQTNSTARRTVAILKGTSANAFAYNTADTQAIIQLDSLKQYLFGDASEKSLLRVSSSAPSGLSAALLQNDNQFALWTFHYLGFYAQTVRMPLR